MGEEARFDGPHLHLHGTRLVDFYYPNGTHYRDLYRIYAEVNYDGGRPTAVRKAWLTCNAMRCIAELWKPTRETVQLLREAYFRDLDEIKALTEALVDDVPMNGKWFWYNFPVLNFRDTSERAPFPLRYRWNGRGWVLKPDCRKVSWYKINEQAKSNRG